MNPDSTQSLLPGADALGQLSASSGGGAFALAAPELGPVLLKLALGLGAVIVLILLLQRMARRFGGGLPRRGDPIQLLAQRPLGPRLSLAVVEVMDRTFLVGVSPHGVEKIADLTASRARQRAAHSLLEEERIQSSRMESLEELSWKERLVRSFARVLSRSFERRAASRDGTSARLIREAQEDTSSRAHGSSPETAASISPGPREAGFEDEFRRRLAEIQSRYPQVSEIDPGIAAPRTSR